MCQVLHNEHIISSPCVGLCSRQFQQVLFHYLISCTSYLATLRQACRFCHFNKLRTLIVDWAAMKECWYINILSVVLACLHCHQCCLAHVEAMLSIVYGHNIMCDRTWLSAFFLQLREGVWMHKIILSALLLWWADRSCLNWEPQATGPYHTHIHIHTHKRGTHYGVTLCASLACVSIQAANVDR